jgi:hypothetical protein
VLHCVCCGSPRTKQRARRTILGSRAEELHSQAKAGDTLPAEGIIGRRVSSCLEGYLDALILGSVSLDQGNAQANIDVGRTDMHRTTGAWIENEKAWDKSADEDGVVRRKSEMPQQMSRLSEDRLGQFGVVTAYVFSVTSQ